MNTDRRLIEPLLAEVFPSVAGASSDEWHFFLDRLAGMETPLSMSNGEAFDRWRTALAGLGYPVNTHSEQRAATAKEAADRMLENERKRAASLTAALNEARREAPDWPVAEVLASVKG
jgi:hypothetical protein